MASDAAGRTCRDESCWELILPHEHCESDFDLDSKRRHQNPGMAAKFPSCRQNKCLKAWLRANYFFTDRLRIQPAEIGRNKTRSNSSPVGGRNQTMGRERSQLSLSLSLSSREIDFPMFLIFTDKEGAMAEVRKELCGPLALSLR